MVTAEHPCVVQTAGIPTSQPDGFSEEASRVTRGLSLHPRTLSGQVSGPRQQSQDNAALQTLGVEHSQTSQELAHAFPLDVQSLGHLVLFWGVVEFENKNKPNF